MIVKTCPACREAFVSPNNRQRFCSKSCGAMTKRVPTPTRICESCGIAFERHEGEKPVHFNRRKRCGFYCRPVKEPDKTGRGRARLLYEARPCEVCGAEPNGRGTVDRHHINSNRMDNRPENIAFLCRRHHNAAHRLSDGRIGGRYPARVRVELVAQ